MSVDRGRRCLKNDEQISRKKPLTSTQIKTWTLADLKGSQQTWSPPPTNSRRGRLVPLECKRTFYQPEICPGRHWRSLQRSPSPLTGGCHLPQNRTPTLGPLGLWLHASPLTRNRRLGPSLYDGLDPHMNTNEQIFTRSTCFPLFSQHYTEQSQQSRGKLVLRCSLLDAECARFLDGNGQLFKQLLEWSVRRKVQTIEAGVSPVHR